MAKHSLLVGINAYANAQFNLRGCVNDVESLARLLNTVYGFGANDIAFLRDKDATRANILAGLNAMLATAQNGDTVVFAYSGHGTQVASTDTSEDDLKDECLVPYEANYATLIKDNELHDIFSQYAAQNLKLTAIYDCCHSGTMYRTLTVAADGSFVEDIVNRFLAVEDLAGFKTRGAPIRPYNILSACLDNETAADVREAGPERLPRGAFSYALHGFLAGSPDVPLVLAQPQIATGIAALGSHQQTPSYGLVSTNSPLIQH